jgi:zinc transport system substrate-binding protein
VRVQRAKLFIYNGAGLEPWADKLRRDLAAQGPRVVRATEKIVLLTASEAPGRGSDPGTARDRSDRDAADPHVWLDPLSAQAQVEAIRAGLAAVDPAGASVYTANAEAFKAKLGALHAAFQAGLRQCARRDVVTSHAAFAYLTRRYDLTQVAIQGLAPEAEPSPADLAGLVTVARAKGVKSVFFEPLVSPKLAETLAREVGARTLVLNPIEGLTPEEQAAGRGYLSLMEANLQSLRTGLDCK